MKLGISVQNGKKKHNYFCESEKQQPFVWTDYTNYCQSLFWFGTVS